MGEYQYKIIGRVLQKVFIKEGKEYIHIIYFF